MAIVLDGSTGISSIGTLTGVTSISSTTADTPVILQDSSSNSNTCRAWVNFNGTSTVAIRADFNVSSITDNGTGAYTVNFTTAMPSADYSAVVSSGNLGNSGGFAGVYFDPNVAGDQTPTTTGFRVGCRLLNGAAADGAYLNVAIFR
jgi:hypothetical protein